MDNKHPQELAAEQLEAMRTKIDAYKEKLFTRFKDYILGMSVLPPRPPEALPENYPKDAVSLLILLDDSDTKKLTKEQLKEKLTTIFAQEAKEIDSKLQPEILLLTELWDLCKDAKYEVLQDIALSTTVYDVGVLQAIKLVEIHKQMVLKKFEKYIVAYVLGGSLVQGTATTKSDVDVFIVIDDTDVKKMTRTELRDKLRSIIIDQGFQAGELTGVKNKINIQVYILTDFWDNIKEANPVIFTFLRDGIPLYDRGIFMPWKQLLEMGRIKPSQEAIDQFITYGDQYLKRVTMKLKEIAVDDFFWATVTPSQAAIMLDGNPPPTPKELVSVMRETFVKKKLFKEKNVKDLEYVLKVRKAIEHGDKLEVSGAEIDDLYKKSEDYLKELNALFETLQEKKDEEHIKHLYDNIQVMLQDLMRAYDKEVKQKDLRKAFKEEFIEAGRIPQRYLEIYDLIEEQHGALKKKKTAINRAELSKLQREAGDFYKTVIEHLQRKQLAEHERAKIRIQQGESVHEFIFTEKNVYLIKNISGEREYLQLDLAFTPITPLSEEECDAALAQETYVVAKITKAFCTAIEKHIGTDYQIVL